MKKKVSRFKFLANKAFNLLNYTRLGDSYICVSHYFAIKSLPLGANLYVKNLKAQNPHETFNDLSKLFSKFGQILSVKLHLNPDETTKDFAYIQFNSREAAEQAKASLHKQEYNGNVLEVENYRKQSIKPVSGELNNLFVKGFPADTTEDELLEEFKSFGLVKTITIAQGKGFGYVSFENVSQAEDAIIGMRDKLFKGQYISVEVYENKHQRPRQEEK